MKQDPRPYHLLRLDSDSTNVLASHKLSAVLRVAAESEWEQANMEHAVVLAETAGQAKLQARQGSPRWFPVERSPR